MYSLRNKLVLITGASSGIGEATALAFSRENMKISLVGRNEKRLAAISKNINEKSQSVAKIFTCDLQKTNKIPELVKEIESVFMESVDILINAAGIITFGYIEDIPIEECFNIFNINFFAPLALIQAVTPAMKEKNSGQIINITSGAGIRGLPSISSYCATKFALNGLTESLRVELKSFGIKVLLFSPGPTKTNLIKNQKIFGGLKENFTTVKMNNPHYIGERILRASKLNASYVEVSFRSKIARHLNYWAPSIFDRILKKHIQNV